MFQAPSASISSKEITLFHGKCRNANAPIRPVLRARFGRAVSGHTGNFVFATPYLPYAHLFSIKINELAFLDTCIPNGNDFVPLLIAGSREAYYRALGNKQSIVVRIMSDEFHPQPSRLPEVTEWTSLRDVEISNDNIQVTKGIDEAMDFGVQILFVENGCPREDFRQQFGSVKNKKAFLAQGIESGTLIWENRRKNIQPYKALTA